MTHFLAKRFFSCFHERVAALFHRTYCHAIVSQKSQAKRKTFFNEMMIGRVSCAIWRRHSREERTTNKIRSIDLMQTISMGINWCEYQTCQTRSFIFCEKLHKWPWKQFMEKQWTEWFLRVSACAHNPHRFSTAQIRLVEIATMDGHIAPIFFPWHRFSSLLLFTMKFQFTSDWYQIDSLRVKSDTTIRMWLNLNCLE